MQVRTRKHLLSTEKTRLVAAILTEWDTYIVAQKPSQREAAEYFSKKLGIAATRNHIENIVSDLGKGWPNGNSNTANRHLRAEVLTSLCNAILDIDSGHRIEETTLETIRQWLLLKDGE